MSSCEVGMGAGVGASPPGEGGQAYHNNNFILAFCQFNGLFEQFGIITVALEGIAVGIFVSNVFGF